MRYTVFFIAFIGITFSSWALDLRLGMQTGLGSYKMQDMKWLNQSVSTNLPFEAKTLHNYPSWYYFQPMAKISHGHFCLGLVYSFHSTGSRISVKDFSGEYRFDTKINAHTAGIMAGATLLSQKHYRPAFRIGIESGIARTALALKEFIHLQPSQTEIENHTFKSTHFYLKPGVAAGYSFQSFTLEFNLDYFLQLSDDHLKGKNKTYLQKPDGTKLNADWRGFRTGISVFYAIPLRKQ